MNLGTFSIPKRRFDDATFLSTDALLVAGADILAGDVVFNSAQGAVPMPFACTMPWSGTSWSSSIPAPVTSADTLQGSLITTNANTTGVSSSVACWPDGEFAVLSADNVGVFKVDSYTAAGATKVTGLIAKAPGTSSYPYSDMCILNNGSIVAVWTNTTSDQRFTIVTRTGATVVSSQQYDTTDTGISPRVAALASGNFVIAYRDNAGAIKFRRYDATGGSLGASATVEAVSPTSIGVAGLPNGDFVIAYTRSSDGNVRFARYNGSGTLQGSITTVATGSNTDASVAALPNGRFVIPYRINSSSILVLTIYSGAGTLLFTNTTSIDAGAPRVATGPLGSIVVATQVSNNPGYHRFNSAGALLSSVEIETTANSNYFAAAFTPSDQILVAYARNGNTSRCARYSSSSSAIMGVAVEPAAAGNFFRVRTVGERLQPISVRLRQNLISTYLPFDHRSGGGIAGVLNNGTALLRGF